MALMVKQLLHQHWNFCFPTDMFFSHKRNNTEEHLKGVSSAGKKYSMTFLEIKDNMGLVNCDSQEGFDVSLGHLYQQWEKLSPRFRKWFLNTQADVFRHHVTIKPVRERAQL